MSHAARINLMDPMIYQSSYINTTPERIIKIDFWKKFNFWSFLVNLLLPLAILIFILFVLKYKHDTKVKVKKVRDPPIYGWEPSLSYYEGFS